MKLFVEFVNHGGRCVGEEIPNTSRVVDIQLTEEQAEQLKPRSVATIGGKEIYEIVRPIALQGEER